jgi:hypothetical protein
MSSTAIHPGDLIGGEDFIHTADIPVWCEQRADPAAPSTFHWSTAVRQGRFLHGARATDRLPSLASNAASRASEIVKHGVEADHVVVVFCLFAERFGQQAPHLHPHREVLALVAALRQYGLLEDA